MKVAETLHTVCKFTAIAGIYSVSPYTLVAAVSSSGRRALGTTLNIGDCLSRLEGEGTVGIVNSKGET